MGQSVYVITILEGTGKHKAWQPIAVVTNPDIATQIVEQYGKNADWMPLELDDVKDINPEKMPAFRPRESTSGEQQMQELREQVEATIQRMQKVIDDQAAYIKKLTKGRTGAERVTILPEEPRPTGKSVYDPVAEDPRPLAEDPHAKPPKPAGFSETLDAQEIVDYIETHALYAVDHEFVRELFRGTHAVLKLVPISELHEGERDANQRSKKNEDKYLKQDIKTQPPILVENGAVVDGNHRFRANKRRGLTHIWCYVVE